VALGKSSTEFLSAWRDGAKKLAVARSMVEGDRGRVP
jgi:hypothetical protein